MSEKIELKVAEALISDVGRGLIRLDSEARKKLNVETGDVVEITGKKKSTAAIVWQAHPQDEGQNILRMDGYLRHNAGAALGDKVGVSKAEAKPATKLSFSPTQPIRFSPGFDEYLKRRLIGRPITKGDMIFVGMLGTSFPLVATVVQPGRIATITDLTEVLLHEEPVKEVITGSRVSYDDIGGLREVVTKVREMVELPLRHPELFERLGIEPPKGVLLYGSPGTGKTLLAKAVANESDAHFISINGPELVSKFVGESEERLREVFKEAEDNAPSIIFMDEIDAIAPKREESIGEVEKRMVSQLLALMDGLKARGKVIVIAATNRPNAIDPALRRAGRFDREIEIGVPNRNSRKEILQIHTRSMPLEKDVNLDELADITHGFVGADVSLLCKEAAMKLLRKILPGIDLDKEIPAEVLNNLKVTRADFFDALREVRPSALREVFVEVPNVKWSDVGDLEKVKQDIKEMVELPLKHPEVFSKAGIRPAKGLLLVGPPGCGKTLLAKAVATESEANFVSVKGPEVLSKWVGESEKAVREIFQTARQAAPCIIFIDEIDGIAEKRGMEEGGAQVVSRIVNTLLMEMDGLTNLNGVVVLAATNRPDILDTALLRPGRFDRIVSIPAPNEKARFEIFKVHTKNMPLDKDVILEELAKRIEGYSGADIEGICREAGMNAIRENLDFTKITMENFEKALKNVRSTITKERKQAIDEFVEQTSYI